MIFKSISRDLDKFNMIWQFDFSLGPIFATTPAVAPKTYCSLHKRSNVYIKQQSADLFQQGSVSKLKFYKSFRSIYVNKSITVIWASNTASSLRGKTTTATTTTTYVTYGRCLTLEKSFAVEKNCFTKKRKRELYLLFGRDFFCLKTFK